MSTYSFQDVNATIVGPGGAFSLGSDQAVANEGISVEFVGDKNTMTTGAGSEVMHSLHASRAATFTVRLMKTSPTNALLSAMYELQASSSSLWGTNTLMVSDVGRGDIATGLQAAFTKFPNNQWGTEGNTLDWVFHVGKAHEFLGPGLN